MKKRISDYGITVGAGTQGPRDQITDVPGVRVGHFTVKRENVCTGVTVIVPAPGNLFTRKVTAACSVQNGFGKTQGLVQVDELGTIETPIALTNTLNVGKVHDALVTYTAEQCASAHVGMRSVNPVVGECNDSRMNDILVRPIGKDEVFSALATADETFEEGDVGAGAGTVCHGLKGGIGSASRILEIAGVSYTMGVLVQSNHGNLSALTIRGRRIGQEILEARNQHAGIQESDQGSIMMILGTDLPVSDRQLRRILRRCSVGLARCGSYFGHGSGDIMIGFTTANRVPSPSMHAVLPMQVLTEHTLEEVFRETADATEEAVLNSMINAKPGRMLDGTVVESLADWLDRLGV